MAVNCRYWVGRGEIKTWWIYVMQKHINNEKVYHKTVRFKLPLLGLETKPPFKNNEVLVVAFVRYSWALSESCNLITFLACYSTVVVLPVHFGPSISTTPNVSRCSCSILSAILYKYLILWNISLQDNGCYLYIPSLFCVFAPERFVFLRLFALFFCACFILNYCDWILIFLWWLIVWIIPILSLLSLISSHALHSCRTGYVFEKTMAVATTVFALYILKVARTLSSLLPGRTERGWTYPGVVRQCKSRRQAVWQACGISLNCDAFRRNHEPVMSRFPFTPFCFLNWLGVIPVIFLNTLLKCGTSLNPLL